MSRAIIILAILDSREPIDAIETLVLSRDLAKRLVAQLFRATLRLARVLLDAIVIDRVVAGGKVALDALEESHRQSPLATVFSAICSVVETVRALSLTSLETFSSASSARLR